MIRFAYPLLLLFLPFLAIFGVMLWTRKNQRPRMAFSSVELLRGIKPTIRMRFMKFPLLLSLLAAACITLALARPQMINRENRTTSEGIDIVLVMDISQSMIALDFRPNRLERSKEVVKEFISKRKDDRIGIVIFGRDSFALTPLTTDYKALANFVDRINFDLLNSDGTAIGMGLANAVNRLRKEKTKSKVVILLTDGENNAGRIDPISAANAAKEFNIRVYTIGVGTANGEVEVPSQSVFGFATTTRVPAKLDIDQLTKMAEMTGGQFFHAKDDKSLETIYSQIDKMERSKIEVSDTLQYDDLAHYLMLPAVGLLLLSLLFESTWLRTFP